MRSEKEAYQQLRKWGYSRHDAKAISKGLYGWMNKPDDKSEEKVKS